MNFLTYIIFRCFVFLFRVVPFRLLFIFSDLLFYFVYYVTGYRKKVVFTNLRNSFPEFSEEQIRAIGVSFYRHLTDMIIESLKAFSLSEDDVIRRYRFLNPEVVNEFYRSGRSVICVAGHYGNWEWGGIAAGKQLLHKPVGFYKPLSNQYVDRFVQRARVQGRSVLAPITRTAHG